MTTTTSTITITTSAAVKLFDYDALSVPQTTGLKHYIIIIIRLLLFSDGFFCCL